MNNLGVPLHSSLNDSPSKEVVVSQVVQANPEALEVPDVQEIDGTVAPDHTCDGPLGVPPSELLS